MSPFECMFELGRACRPGNCEPKGWPMEGGATGDHQALDTNRDLAVLVREPRTTLPDVVRCAGRKRLRQLARLVDVEHSLRRKDQRARPDSEGIRRPE